eukprot:jgi/Mesen1/7541/ME000392S06808
MAVAGKKLTFPLNTGAEIPAVGLGTWKAEPGKMKEVVATALEDAGYRHIDCAYAYHNQHEIGEALQEVFSKGKIKREDVFITSKLWATHAQPAHVGEALDQTLKDLQLDYLDLYLIHWPVVLHPEASNPPKPEDYRENDLAATWHAMEAQMAASKTKAIGVSNFSVAKVEKLLSSALLKPAVNQVESHPAWRNEKTLSFCKSKGIHVTAYSPLGSGDSTSVEDPDSDEDKSSLINHSTVKKIAEKIGKSTGQVLLRWGVQRGMSVLPKSTNPERIKQNIDVLDWELSAEDFEALNTMEPQVKSISGEGLFIGLGSPYKTKEELWDGEV